MIINLYDPLCNLIVAAFLNLNPIMLQPLNSSFSGFQTGSMTLCHQLNPILLDGYSTRKSLASWELEDNEDQILDVDSKMVVIDPTSRRVRIQSQTRTVPHTHLSLLVHIQHYSMEII